LEKQFRKRRNSFLPLSLQFGSLAQAAALAHGTSRRPADLLSLLSLALYLLGWPISAKAVATPSFLSLTTRAHWQCRRPQPPATSAPFRFARAEPQPPFARAHLLLVSWERLHTPCPAFKREARTRHYSPAASRSGFLPRSCVQKPQPPRKASPSALLCRSPSPCLR
jgi:hypothetical protein